MKLEHDNTYEWTVGLAQGWGVGTHTFASRAKGGNVQVDFHCRLAGHSLSRPAFSGWIPPSQGIPALGPELS